MARRGGGGRGGKVARWRGGEVARCLVATRIGSGRRRGGGLKAERLTEEDRSIDPEHELFYTLDSVQLP